MSVLLVCWIAAVLAVSSCNDQVFRQNAKKPNFIIFLMDDVSLLFYNNMTYVIVLQE